MATRMRTDAGSPLTTHARSRLFSRHIPEEAVSLVIDYGREVPTRGALVYAIGRKEVERWSALGIDLSDYNGVQVVCSTDEDSVVTVYRNKNFRRLKPNLGRGRPTRARRRSAE